MASSTGAMREKWLLSIYKEIENFLQNMAIDDADPALVVAWKEKGKWPLPCQMVFVLKPLTQSQQEENDVHGTSMKKLWSEQLRVCWKES